MSKFFKPTAILAAISITLGLAACGSDSKSGDSAQSDLAPKNADTITINNGGEPDTLDPQKESDTGISAIVRQMLSGLVESDSAGKTVPALAEKWDVSEDGKTWTFHLRDAKWSNGDPITADDFVFSWRRLVDPATASNYAAYLSDAKVVNAEEISEGKAKPETLGVRAVDDKTFEVKLTTNVPYFVDMLTHVSLFPVNRKTVEKNGDKWTLPENYVVSGAYKLDAWSTNNYIKLSRNDKYYANDKTSIDKVVFLAVPPSNNEINRYRAGEIDVTYTVIADQFQKMKKELGSQLHVNPDLCSYYLTMNLKKPPFTDPRVRHALSLLTDREIITDKVFARGEKPLYQITPPATQNMTELTPEWKSWDKAKRVAEAKKLLNEAGYNESKPLTFEYLYGGGESSKRLTNALTSMWSEAISFVKPNPLTQEGKVLTDSRAAGKFQMITSGWCADYNDPSTFLTIFLPGNANNYGKYDSAEFNETIAGTFQPGATTEQRAALYQKAESILDKDAPIITLYSSVHPRLVKPYVENFPANDPLDGWLIRDWSLKKK